MLISPTAAGAHSESHSKPQAAPGPQRYLRRRRAATAMEYLFVLSLIFVVAMVGVNYFGQATKKTAAAASQAIQSAIEDKNPSSP
jgi:hypothetical protein